MAINLKIHLLNEDKKFYPGAEVKGKAELFLPSPLSVSAIKCLVKGKIKLSYRKKNDDDEYYWTNEKKSCADTTHTTLFPGCMYNQTMPAGRHQFPFTVLVPQNSPASFSLDEKDINVIVVYHVKIDCDIAGVVTKAKEEIQVLSYLDVNGHHAVSAEPDSVEKSYQICCWCCVGGTYSYFISLDKTAYVLGDDIVVSLNLHNKCRKSVDYRVSFHYRTAIKGLTSNTDKALYLKDTTSHEAEHVRNKKRTNKKDNLTIPIPSTIPVLKYPFEDAIHCDHYIQVLIFPDGCRLMHTEIIPVVIGTHDSSLPNFQMPYQQTQVENTFVMPSAPPSYQDSKEAPSMNPNAYQYGQNETEKPPLY